jgi:hypothetical protein
VFGTREHSGAANAIVSCNGATRQASSPPGAMPFPVTRPWV